LGLRLGLLLAREPSGLAVGVHHHRTTRGPGGTEGGRDGARRGQFRGGGFSRVRPRANSRVQIIKSLIRHMVASLAGAVRRCGVGRAMARWNDRGKTRRVGRKRLAERSAIQHDASRAPPRRARLGTYFSQSDSPHDRPLGGGGGPDAAVAPRARAASRRGGHDGVSLHGGAGNHILCHRGRHRSPRSLRSYPSAPRIAWWDSGPRLDAMAQTLAREFSLVERDGGRSGQSPVAVDGAGVDYVRRSTNEGAWSTSHLSVDGRASVKLTSPRARLFFSLLSSSGWG